jgi:ribulose-5-phosphate 4-epimerase/fuculose-1-phosphate aldolase
VSAASDAARRDAAHDDAAGVIPALIAAGRRVGAKQLTWGTAGNISARVPGGFVITASGARLDELTPASFLTCPLKGELPRGCSVESDMHRGVYRVRPDVNAVLHSSAFHTTLVACSEIELETAASTDTQYYLQRLARLPFLPPGSPELAAAVTEAAAEHDVMLLANHGSVALAADVDAAVNVTEALELMCRMLVARTQGFPLMPIRDS